jgi:hypothetical protein
VRTRLAALIGAAVLTSLAGCGSDLGPDIHPGSAAIVGDVDVSFGEVDDFADGICDWQRPVLKQDGRAWPMSYVKAVAVDSIVDDLLTHQFAEEKGLEPATGYKQAIASLKKEVAKADVPAKVGATVIEFQSRGVYHDAVLVSAGLSDLAGEGKTADQAGALQRGEEVFAKWRDSVDVSIDPRFGTVEGDALDYAAPGDALSVRVSDVAKRAAAGQADTEYVESLPASQRCGGA